MNNSTLAKIVALEAPTYRNTTKILTLGGMDLTLWDVIKASLAARLNIGLYGGAGMGKSQLLADVQGLFGNNASYVLGRNDLDIKSLFREMNFAKLKEAQEKGTAVSQQEMSQVTADIYRPLIVVEEITRCAEIVQNQLFNIFEGFIELDGKKYSLGGKTIAPFSDTDGKKFTQNMHYSVGVWSANFGNGQYTGTVSMDKALKERSHLIIDVDNFSPEPSDLDAILLGSGGEIRLKEQEHPIDSTELFTKAFEQFKQGAYTPNPQELGEELLMFRYLVFGLDYIPCNSGKNSKRVMKEVWPGKAEEDNIGNTTEEKLLYRMVYPASVRGAMSIIALARSLREYVRAKKPNSKVGVIDSVIESFKLVGAYSGMLENPQRMREQYSGNPYLAASDIGDKLKKRLPKQLMDAVLVCKSQGKDLPKSVADACVGEYACFK